MKNEVSINLLRTQSTLTQEEILLLTKLRTASAIVLAVVLLAGGFVGVSFLAAKLRYDSLSKQREDATNRIALAAKKEALLLDIKSRLVLVNRGLKSQVPWDNILTTVSQIVTPPNLHTLTVDDQNLLTLDIVAPSLEDVQDIVNKTSELSNENKIKNSHIQSLISQSDGQLEASIQFTPIF